MYRSAFVLCVLYAETLSKILDVAEGTALIPLLFRGLLGLSLLLVQSNTDTRSMI